MAARQDSLVPTRANPWWPERRGNVFDRPVEKTFVLEIKCTRGFGTKGLYRHNMEIGAFTNTTESDIYTA